MKREGSHDFEIHPISFPNNDPKISETKWRNIFKPCACQRLFLPVSLKNCLKIKNRLLLSLSLKKSLLPDVDSVLYMDSDSIFLAPPETFWDQFNKMNSSQVIGIAHARG
jgi:UDP-xylose:glucoside alpha-1,3-xylosyltransferase